MSFEDKVVEITNIAAGFRREPELPEKFIRLAWQRVQAGQEGEIEYFISGLPDCLAIYNIALRLEAQASTKQ